MSSIQSQLDDLCERVKLLERIHTKTNRGRTNQRGAAAYLNRSRRVPAAASPPR